MRIDYGQSPVRTMFIIVKSVIYIYEYLTMEKQNYASYSLKRGPFTTRSLYRHQGTLLRKYGLSK